MKNAIIAAVLALSAVASVSASAHDSGPIKNIGDIPATYEEMNTKVPADKSAAELAVLFNGA